MESRTVVSGADLEAVRRLFGEYAQWVAIDLSFQGFADEVADLPGEYVAPHGTLLLCVVEKAAAGCVAVRPCQTVACEMKRLYVREAFQGRGCGLFLARRAIEWAKRAGYRRMLLDTLPTMAAAQRLYEGLGFREVAPYRFNPIPGARFMELPLVSAAKRANPDGVAGR
ncbi:MAG: GNAT family N-acetyltransferase [Vicinamibacteria bacterium]